MDMEVSPPVEYGEDQNLTFLPNEEGNNRGSSAASKSPGSLALTEPGIMRKRGRPSMKNVNKRKAVANQARRTRARIGSKPAKITGNDSDDSVSHEENTSDKDIRQMEESQRIMDKETSNVNKGKPGTKQARMTRTRIGKKPAKISDCESDDTLSHEETTAKEETQHMNINYEKIDENTSKIPETQRPKDNESSKKRNAAEQEVGEKDVRHWFSKVPEVKMTEKHSSENSKPPLPEKLERMTDPVHAMLLNMIPSLAKDKAETTSTSSEVKKQPPEQNPAEPKKKKVSYKDLARELLDD